MKKELLQVLKEKVSSCNKCEGLLQSRVQPVFGNGNPNSRVMLIGEAPGENEAKEGEPFVGKAGKLMNNMLDYVGLNRTDVYVTNVIRCRPPGNRTPTEEECANCSPFLKYHIKIINPEFIICAGSVAAQALLKVKTPVSALRGRWHDYEGCRVLVTWHPSFLLRQPEHKEETIADYQMLINSL